MGDRSSVTLSVLKGQKDAVRAIIRAATGSAMSGDESYDELTWDFNWDEVNYGQLEFLPQLLAAGIPYDSAWEAGSEFGEGTEYGRFAKDGDIVVTTIYDSEYLIPIHELKKRIDTPDELRQYILDREAKIQVDDLDETQIEYGKLHRAKQLIAPTENLSK